jgi:hypothetical protein
VRRPQANPRSSEGNATTSYPQNRVFCRQRQRSHWPIASRPRRRPTIRCSALGYLDIQMPEMNCGPSMQGKTLKSDERQPRTTCRFLPDSTHGTVLNFGYWMAKTKSSSHKEIVPPNCECVCKGSFHYML